MKKIKVLHLTNNDVLGGAARYVMRLHESLLENGIESQILALQKESDSRHVIEITRNSYLFRMQFCEFPIIIKLRSHHIKSMRSG